MGVSRWIIPPRMVIARSGEHYISQSGTLVMEEGQTHAHVVPFPFCLLVNGLPIPRTIWVSLFLIHSTTASFRLNLYNLRKR